MGVVLVILTPAAAAICSAAGVLSQHPRKERIMLANRKGFVRVAVEEGLDGGIVPVYHFGNTQVRHCNATAGIPGIWLCAGQQPVAAAVPGSAGLAGGIFHTHII
jgi:hypothetical protein